MQICQTCRLVQPEINRCCTACGSRLGEDVGGGSAPYSNSREPGQLNIRVLYAMVAALGLALLFPPWETPPDQPPEFLGMHFLLSPPTPEAVVSRMLLTIELVTIAIAGLYGAFLLRTQEHGHVRTSRGPVTSRELVASRNQVVEEVLLTRPTVRSDTWPSRPIS